jgi:hypothetical protein
MKTDIGGLRHLEAFVRAHLAAFPEKKLTRRIAKKICGDPAHQMDGSIASLILPF